MAAWPPAQSRCGTGIRNSKVAEVVREVWYSIKPDGAAMLLFMPYQNGTVDELKAIYAYLQSLKPVNTSAEK